MKHFDGLKLEFFLTQHDDMEGSPKHEMVVGSLPLGAFNDGLREGTLRFSEDMRVSDVESELRSAGINGQVFRKMGQTWIETTKTDHYTLKEQMELSN